MKILKTCLSKSWGGMEMYALQTSQFLLELGYEVELLCYPGSKIYSEAVINKIHVIQFPFDNYFSPRQIFNLNKHIRNNNFDVIHAEASKDLWLIVPALKLSSINIPLLLTKHVGSYVKKKDIFHRWIYNRVNMSFAISNVIRKNLIETTPLNKDRIYLLHDPVDVNKFNPELIDRTKVRKEFDISDDELLIGMNARMSFGKGHEEFLYAAKQLSLKHKNLKFMIVGEASRGEDKYAASIKSLANELGLNDKLIFTGFRNDIPEVLAALDIFVFPSHDEAFGIALIEAMSMKLPTVCANYGGVLDIAVNEKTSLLFQRKDGNDLEQKLNLLINDPVRRKQFGIAARGHVEKNFSKDSFVNKLKIIYDSAVSTKAISLKDYDTFNSPPVFHI